MLEIRGLSFRDYIKELKKIKAGKGRKIMLETFWADLVYTWYDEKKIEKLKMIPPKVIDNRILFETRTDFEGEGKIFYDYLIKQGYNKKYEIIWLVKNPKKYKKYARENVRFISSHIKFDRKRRNAKAYKYMLSSHYIFYDYSVNWIAMTRKKQIFVDLWHGCDYAVDVDRKRIFFDYCLTPGEIFNFPMKELLGCTMRKMMPLGYPHYDEIIQENNEAEKFRGNVLKESGGLKLMLWCPSDEKKLADEEIRQLDELCRENRIHLLVNTQIQESGSGKILTEWCTEHEKKLTNISQCTEKELKKAGIDIYQLLHVTDALLSDYSSFMVDFLLLDRPLAAEIVELNEQKQWIFNDYPDFMPGRKVYSFKDICAFVKDVAEGRDEMASERRLAAERIFDRCDNYCQRIADCIFEESGERK